MDTSKCRRFVVLLTFIGATWSEPGDTSSKPRPLAPPSRLRAFRAASHRSLCFSYRDSPHNLTEAESSFLPDPARATRGPCQDRDTDLLRTHLLRLADPQSCAPEGQVLVEAPTYGFGSMVSGWLKPFMYTVEHNLTMWSPLLKVEPPYYSCTARSPRGLCFYHNN